MDNSWLGLTPDSLRMKGSRGVLLYRVIFGRNVGVGTLSTNLETKEDSPL